MLLLSFTPFKMLVCIFNHHNGAVYHCADGNGNAAKAHDIHVYFKIVHHDEGYEDGHRQHKNGNKCRPEMQEEDDTYEGNDNEFFYKFFLECCNGPMDEAAPVISCDNMNARRQTRL